MGDVDRACEASQNALEQVEGSQQQQVTVTETWLSAAYDDAVTQNTETLLYDCSAILEKNPLHVEALVLQALAWHKSKRYSESQKNCLLAYQTNPKNYLVLAISGLLLYLNGDTEKALERIYEAISIDPQCRMAVESLIKILINEKSYREAKAVCKEFLENKQDSKISNFDEQLKDLLDNDLGKSGFYYLPIDRWLNQGEYKKTHNYLDSVLKHDPENRRALSKKAKTLLAERRFEEANCVAETLGSLGVDPVYVLCLKSHAAREGTKALEYVQEAVYVLNGMSFDDKAKEAKQIEVKLASGWALLKNQDYTEAAAAFLTAQVLSDQNSIEATMGEAYANYYLEQYSYVLASIEKVLSDRNDYEALAIKARSLYMLSKVGQAYIENAHETSLEAIAMNPVAYETLLVSAEITIERKNFESASDWVKKLIRLFPHEDAGYRLYLEMPKAFEVDELEVEEKIKALIARHPEDQHLRKRLGNYYFHHKNYTDAYKIFASLVQQDELPKNEIDEELYEKIAECHFRKKQYELCFLVLNNLQEKNVDNQLVKELQPLVSQKLEQEREKKEEERPRRKKRNLLNKIGGLFGGGKQGARRTQVDTLKLKSELAKQDRK